MANQFGFTFVEVMVGVVVIAIGLLGLAALRTVGVFNAHVSHLHSIASVHSENIAEMMRANINAVDSNVYGVDINYSILSSPSFDCRTSFPGSDTLCTPANQALVDASNWITAIRRDLPAGTGGVTCNDSDTSDPDPCNNGSTHTIRVGWAEKDLEQQTLLVKSFTTVFAP